MNPFDEFPDPDKLFERVANYEWVRFAFKDEALAWRKKWELIITEAMRDKGMKQCECSIPKLGLSTVYPKHYSFCPACGKKLRDVSVFVEFKSRS